MRKAISDPTSLGSAVLAIFTKIPGCGVPVKTRLQHSSALSTCDIEALAEGFLIDTVSAVFKAAQHSIAIVSDPKIDFETLNRIFSRHQTTLSNCDLALRFLGQERLPFGNRLQAALELLLAEYQAPIVLVGTDTPVLSPATLLQATRIVQKGRYAIGPSSTGGFYLLGIPQNALAHGFSVKTLFSDPHASELELLCLTIKDINGEYELLAPQFDIDTEEDLITLLDFVLALKNQAAQDSNTCISAYPAASAKIIDKLGLRVDCDAENNRSTKIEHG